MTIVGIKLTEEQVKAVEAAFADSDGKMVDKLRVLVAEGLAARGIIFPATPAHGGKRRGSGRPKNK